MLAAVLVALGSPGANAKTTVDDARLVAADADRANWLTHGRTYAEQRYSPLDDINDGNVADLELLWTFPTGLTRGHEATPIVVDGVLYFTGSWSVVFAVDARTNLADPVDVFFRWCANTDPGRDLHARGSKIGFDATAKGPDEGAREWPPEIVMTDEIRSRVDARWAELGLPERDDRGTVQNGRRVTTGWRVPRRVRR